MMPVDDHAHALALAEKVAGEIEVVVLAKLPPDFYFSALLVLLYFLGAVIARDR